MSSTSLKESFGDIIKGKRPVLVDFSAEWCGPCKMMGPVLKELHQSLGNAVRILKVDIDKNPHVASAYNVNSVPTLILFKEGRLLWRQSGVMPAHQLAQVIYANAQLNS